jgi:DNA-binding SARP family transcriptional activator
VGQVLDFRVLGPVEVHVGGEPVPVPTTRVRTLLATLLLRANRAVAVDELVDTMWGEHLPANPRAAVQTNLARLRRALGPGAVIDTLPHGYLLRTAESTVDLLRFRALVARAHRTGDPARRHDLLRAALALWRGAPLGGVASDLLLHGEVPRLWEERHAAWEEAVELRLALGGHAAAVAELTASTAAYPLRERQWGLLMLALYRDGRQADALGAYRRLAGQLVEQVGVAPSGSLQRLHRAILAADPRLDPPRAPAPERTGAPGGPPGNGGWAAGCWWCAVPERTVTR